MDSTDGSAGAKRPAEGDSADEDPLRSMARRRKSAQAAAKEVQQCRECDKVFKRPCDLTSDFPFAFFDHTDFLLGSTKKLTPGRGSATRRAAGTTSTAGRRRRSATAMSMTNTRRTRQCTNASTVRAPMKASAKAIANSTWRRRTAGPMSDRKTTANPRKPRRARLHQLLKSQLQSLILPALNLVRHLALTITAGRTA